MTDQDVTRRTVLKTGAGGAVAALLADSDTMATATMTESMDVYKTLGIRPIINAAGTIT